MKKIAEALRMARKKIGLPEMILIAALLYVALSFLLYYLIDLRNFLGIRDWLFSVDRVYFYFTYTPFFFQHYGRNSGFAELVQWSFLGASMLLAAWYAGRVWVTHPKVARFYLWMSAAFVLMLLEDAGDVRHTLMSYVQLAAGEPDQGLFGTAFEGAYFAVLAGVPLYALWRYWETVKEYGKVFWYIILGFVAHAVAASLSFVGTAFQMLLERDVYTILGEWLVSFSIKIGDDAVPLLWEAWNAKSWLYQVGFYLMDSLIEENIELIGNAAFLASLVAFGILLKRGALPKKEK